MDNYDTPHKEPEEFFQPLGSDRYAAFYSLEMDSVSRDLDFYLRHCDASASVLELGCGTGRIANHLAAHGRKVTGIDLSPHMLKRAMRGGNAAVRYICMDMCRLAFAQRFNHILIPYNTLNLLQNSSAITACLQSVTDHLAPDGTLLFQLYIPDSDLRSNAASEKTFQFQILPLGNNGGKLIKESIRSYTAFSDSFTLEERYRYRPQTATGKREDFSHSLSLAGYSLTKWKNLLSTSSLQLTSLLTEYGDRPFDAENDTSLFGIAKKSA